MLAGTDDTVEYEAVPRDVNHPPCAFVDDSLDPVLDAERPTAVGQQFTVEIEPEVAAIFVERASDLGGGSPPAQGRRAAGRAAVGGGLVLGLSAGSTSIAGSGLGAP